MLHHHLIAEPPHLHAVMADTVQATKPEEEEEQEEESGDDDDNGEDDDDSGEEAET